MDSNEFIKKCENKKADILSYVPHYYHKSPIFNALMDVEGTEFVSLDIDVEDLRTQFFANTATWGLELWEKEYGLPTNRTLDYGKRRKILLQKMMGMGKVGPETIQAIGDLYSLGKIIVEFTGGNIIITFIGTRGVPKQFEEFKKSIDDIIPAHLGVKYVFTYLKWWEFDMLLLEKKESMTWDELELYRPFVGYLLLWDEFDAMAVDMQESMTWDKLELLEYYF